MKVITQLIHHFWSHGALTVDQADYLVRHGFIAPEDLDGFLGSRSVEPPALSPLELRLDAATEELSRRGTAARYGRPRPRTADVNLDGLCERLRAEFDRRRGDWPALVAAAAAVEPCSDWQSAAVVLRNLSESAFIERIRELLPTRPPRINGLWNSVESEPFHALAADSQLRGPVANAFRAMLKNEDAGALGKYSWVRRAPEVACVSNLLTVEHRLLSALGNCLRHDDGVFSPALQSGAPPVLYWACVYLYNAKLDRAEADRLEANHELGPVDRPQASTTQQAITCALIMQPTYLLKLLELEADDRPLVRPWSWKPPTLI